MTAYEDVLARRVAATGHVAMEGGSGYFAPRASGLDPTLFEHGDHLRPEVRQLILGKLYVFWAKRYHAPREWSTAWIAGSGITTAWNADREGGAAPGDLDVLIGVDYANFYRFNPQYAGNPESALVHHFNQQLHDELWPSTAEQRIGTSTFELTFYVNPGGSDIRDINPYAAYDVSHDQWTVHPVEVPEGFSEDYFDADARHLVQTDTARAGTIVATFNRQADTVAALQPGTPYFVTAARALHQTVRDGADLFSVIHDGRRAAFAPGGKGFFDVANYRWQAGKGSGAVNALRRIKQLDEATHRDVIPQCDDVDHLLLMAGLANGGRR